MRTYLGLGRKFESDLLDHFICGLCVGGLKRRLAEEEFITQDPETPDISSDTVTLLCNNLRRKVVQCPADSCATVCGGHNAPSKVRQANLAICANQQVLWLDVPAHTHQSAGQASRTTRSITSPVHRGNVIAVIHAKCRTCELFSFCEHEQVQVQAVKCSLLRCAPGKRQLSSATYKPRLQEHIQESGKCDSHHKNIRTTCKLELMHPWNDTARQFQGIHQHV